jgi:putative DNA primase/helicase
VVPGLVTTIDNAESIALTQIKSLARQNGMSVTGLEDTILAIADRNQYNPVANWIKSKPWDGHDRLQSFYDTLTEREDFPNQFKELLIKRWMISGVAALFEPVGFRSRGVLTIQGPQSAGKTSWIAALIPDPTLRESSVKLDHHLDAGNKDSQIAAATHFLIEIGELESSFRRDVARLKGFITSDCDKIRLPYARSASVFPRRSVFAATVNDTRFLVDTTGNTRWWVIPVTKINYQHQLDMQQIWAQFTVEYEKGEQWWLTPEEEGLLEMLNRDHRVVSVIEERLMPVLDLSRKNEEGLPAMTPTEVLMKIGYKTVINQQAKECGALLREHLGEPKKIQGYMKWRIPFAKQDDIVKIEDY